MMQAMKPIYISMSFFGLFWRSKANWMRQKTCVVDMCTVHCCITITLAWLNVLKYFTAYSTTAKYGIHLFEKLGPHLLALQIACGITCHVYHKYLHGPVVFKLWEDYKLKYGGISLAAMRRHILVRVILTDTFFIFIQIIFFTLVLILRPKRILAVLLPLYERFAFMNEQAVITAFFILHAYLVLAWLQTSLFSMCVNHWLKEEFHQLTHDFSIEMEHKINHSQIENNENTAIDEKVNNIEQHRQRHMELCRIVSRYDSGISMYLLFLYMFSIPIVVLLMYVLWGLEVGTTHESYVSYYMSIGFLVFFLVILVATTVSASAIATAVSSLFNLPTASVKNEHILRLGSFGTPEAIFDQAKDITMVGLSLTAAG